MDVLHAVWSWLTTWIISTGVAAWVAKKVVEAQQNRQLEKFKADLQTKLETAKAEHQKDVERLRHLLSSRVGKIHEKEFEVMPEAWCKLHELYSWIVHALDLTFKPMLRDMTDEEWEEFMRTAPASHLSESQQETLRKSSDRAYSYNERKASNDMDTANDKQRQFTNYLIENRIFMTEDLRAKFEAVQAAFISALTIYETGKRAGAWEMQTSGQMTMSRENLQGLVDEIEKARQRRLRYEEA
jgi:hypothetical protein